MSAPHPEHGLPRAEVAPARASRLVWLLPVAAAAFALFLVRDAWSARGAAIVVRAQEGHGLRAGDPLRYRGINVGTVEDIRLAPDLGGLELHVRLDPAAEALAREGSRFWIVRPHLSLDSVVGLETLVGVRYLSVLPGAPDARGQTQFVALEEPPVQERVEAEGLEILLEAPSRFSLVPGAAITYREIEVGKVLSVGLASDATSVEVRAYVRSPYVPLVRERTVFWEVGGIEVELALTEGLKIDMGSLRSLVVGGIAMATPNDPGEIAADGQRFVLHAGAEEEWLEWRPPLAVGEAELPDGTPRPEMVRARLRWRQGRLLARDRSRLGWLLPVEGGVLGPSDLLAPLRDAREGSCVLEVAGERIALVDPPAWSEEGLAFLALALPEAATWPRERLGAAAEEEGELLVLGDPIGPPMVLAPRRLERSPSGWTVESALSFDPGWHGASVLSPRTGQLVGFLLLDEAGATIARAPQSWE